jgi:Xaa-Pro aminopeptidase
LGLEIHEQPYLRETEGNEISAGTILTIEPGIYIPGIGGIRIEDDVMITDEGYEVLSAYPKRRLVEIG